MNDILLGLIIVAVLVAIGFLISVLIELRKTARSLRDFLRTQEDSLNTTLDELQQILKSLRSISNGVNEVTTDAKSFSKAVSGIGNNIQHASNILGDKTLLALIKASGLKVGIRTALAFLLNNLSLKKGRRQ